MNELERLGERIKTERVAQGYSVKGAAEGSGIARDTWRKIEAGKSVHDIKRNVAMRFLGLSDANAEWGTVGSLEDHAADRTAGTIDLNVMFSQAVRFTATVGVMVPQVRDEAERVSVALSELFAHGLEQWDRESIDDFDSGEPEIYLHMDNDKEGGGSGDSGSSPATKEPGESPDNVTNLPTRAAMQRRRPAARDVGSKPKGDPKHLDD